MDERPEFLNVLDDDARKMLEAEAEWLSLAAGQTLFSMGEPADALYLLLAGSLGVYVPGVADAQRLVAIIRHGETVGEMGILSNQPRSASVVAIRDCDLMRLSQAKFNQLLKHQPEMMAGLNRILVHRLRQSMHGSHNLLEPKTVALLPCNGDVDVTPVARELVGRLKDQGLRTKVLDKSNADHSSKWFTEQEDAYDHVVLCAQHGDDNWMRTCCRQGDRILIVAAADQPAAADLPQEFMAQRAAHQLLDLVLLHGSSRQPDGTGKWYDALPVNRHFHIRKDHNEDWERLARVIGGRGVGLVLSGGGARAYAHIGAIRAFHDANVPIDFVGGCSMGAIIGAGLAVGWSVDELTERTRRTFVDSNPLSDYSLPIISLVRGHKVERLLRENLGNIEIPDAWLPFYCVSSNLTTAKSVVHNRGDLVSALRASIALPGILPPVITDDGVLADGALISNLPVDVMRSLHRGSIAAVDVARDLALDPDWLRGEINTSSIRRLLRPPIISVLMRAGTVSGEQQTRQQASDADLVIEPPLGNIEIRDWKAFNQAIDIGYEHTARVLSECSSKLHQRRRIAVI
ncbi:MAG: patatin-like phospholipase family protein [Hyphomicrobiales bacterium]|nr:patatin-like phospholipase family protein [Hyphomicrobiales bacterium]